MTIGLVRVVGVVVATVWPLCGCCPPPAGSAVRPELATGSAASAPAARPGSTASPALGADAGADDDHQATTAASAPAIPVGETKRLLVDGLRVDCTGEAPRQCLRVRDSSDQEWTFFYGRIEGFEPSDEYTYDLRVEVLRVARPPADGTSLHYRLIEILSQTERLPP